VRKFGLLCFALVLALGSVGVGYAMWQDDIEIEGVVGTGSVCLTLRGWAEVFECTEPTEYADFPDMNWSGWVLAQGSTSCPPHYRFESLNCTTKDVAKFQFTPMQADGTPIAPGDIGRIPVEKLKVTILNAYPHYAGRLTFDICNCGTIPVILEAVNLTQDSFIVIEYKDGGGVQIEPNSLCHEVSLWIGVVQHEGYFVNPDDYRTYVVDDPTHPILPQNAGLDGNPPLTFTISVTGHQFAE